jgi:hypothetical protein
MTTSQSHITTVAPSPTDTETARERYHDALFFARDADGAAHYWSRYAQAVVVINDGVEYDLTMPVRADDGTVIDSPRDWLDHVDARAGVVADRLVGSPFEVSD